MMVLLPINATENSTNETIEETFTIYGNIYTKTGEIANLTSIKVDSMKSSWSNDNVSSPDYGTYTFEGVTAGEHTIRAYFMNDGHTVSYRKILVESDIELDWYVGMNWVTIKLFDENGDPYLQNVNDNCELGDDEDCSKITDSTGVLIENANFWDQGRAEFGVYEIGEYYSLITTFGGNGDSTCNDIHFKMSGDTPNNFEVFKGSQSKYGYVKDPNGAPLPGVSVSNGVENAITNSDGFYLLQNLTVGNTELITYQQNGEEIVEPINEFINECDGWLNVSSTIDINLPGNVTFESSVQTIPIMDGFQIKWNGGQYTDEYELFVDGVSIQKTQSEFYYFWTDKPGTYEFDVIAKNRNGTTSSYQPFILIVIQEQRNEDWWSVGMSWDYHIRHTPEYQHNRTYTAVGSEIIKDSFGMNKECFLLRVSDDSYEDGEKAYRWVDSENLLNIKTYWADAPSSSSYYVEGTMGWDFTNLNGTNADLLTSDSSLNMHFNRTNIIGVPGHPNGYDDTQNIVNIYKNVMIETVAGNFSTTYFQIIDLKDDVISWELWYNETVRNWVKIIDRLPGSHSDSVISELTSYDVPTSPQFITEGGDFSVKDYTLEWGVFPGTEFYQLFENDVLIYEGKDLSFEIRDRNDGEFTYFLMAFRNDNPIRSTSLNVNIGYILPPPSNIKTIPELNEGINLKIFENESIEISWDEIENIKWYSVIVTDYFGDGITTEVYNGTENKITIDKLNVGQNRIQIKAAIENGKVSEYSSSIFVNVEPVVSPPLVENKETPAPINLALSAVVLLSAAIIKRRGFNG
ncbi:MAG: hypothetical protein CMB56_006615 [Methanobacteriota archaeon]|nr:MAG: hypothetical protein CMB56_006615 [Euryarchaeota archaeon]|tara:strand:- start:14731 stop:17133 length:2403 start_codon:yes stop_codon:yes gene_type:complete